MPRLPELASAELERAVFTHRGHPGHGRNGGGGDGSNTSSAGDNLEMFEWVGDSYVAMLASQFIFLTFVSNGIDESNGSIRGPSGGGRPLDPSNASFLRQRLVRNLTLARYSVLYGFSVRAHLPAEFSGQGRKGGTSAKGSERTKALADVFEGYVGALVLHTGFQTAADWLKSLWAGEIADCIRRGRFNISDKSLGCIWPDVDLELTAEGGTALVDEYLRKKGKVIGESDSELMRQPASQSEVDISASKDELRKQIGLVDVNIRYIPVNRGKTKKHPDFDIPLFTVEALLDGWGEKGVFLGRGTGKSIKEAGQIAARAALDNKKRLKVYVEMKQAFLKRRDGDPGQRETGQSKDG